MTDSKFDFEFDRLKMFFGETYSIKSNDSEIIIKQPTIGDILNIGERNFYSMLYTFTGNPTMFRLFLWNCGVDWNKISDYELFCVLIKNITQESSKIIFGDLDFQTFDLYTKTNNENENNQTTLYSKKHNIEISEEIYAHIAQYLRLMFNIYPKVEKAKGKTTKEWMIEEDKEKLQKEDSNPSSTLLPLVSACVNHPGFKYKTNELKEIGIFQFMDSVQRLQIYENTVALNNGRYSGMCDMSKIDKNLFDFMRDSNYK